MPFAYLVNIKKMVTFSIHVSVFNHFDYASVLKFEYCKILTIFSLSFVSPG